MAAALSPVDRQDLRSTTYEFFILAISVLSIANLVLMLAIPFGSQAWWLVAYVDVALTLIFVVDFGLRLSSAPGKRSYSRRRRVSRATPS
jgi:hypothetical protein